MRFSNVRRSLSDVTVSSGRGRSIPDQNACGSQSTTFSDGTSGSCCVKTISIRIVNLPNGKSRLKAVAARCGRNHSVQRGTHMVRDVAQYSTAVALAVALIQFCYL